MERDSAVRRRAAELDLLGGFFVRQPKGTPMELTRGETIKFRSLLSLLAAVAFAAVPGSAQDREWRPIDPSAAYAMGNSPTAQSSDYCNPAKKRALVLSGGGLKGAFQAGAIYHFIVHRHCDFREIAGVSVGSLNAVILAQAQRDEDPEVSLKNLAERAERLVDVWQKIRVLSRS